MRLQPPISTTTRPRTLPSRIAWAVGMMSSKPIVGRQGASLSRSRSFASRSQAAMRRSRLAMTLSMPSSDTPRRMNGVTVVGQVHAARRGRRPRWRRSPASAPRRWRACATRRSRCRRPIAPCRAACPGFDSSSRPMISAAPRSRRKSSSSVRPVEAMTRQPRRHSKATATEPTPPAAPVTTAGAALGRQGHAASSAMTASMAV